MRLARYAACAFAVTVSAAMQACSPSGSAQGYSGANLPATPAVAMAKRLVVGGFDEARGGSESLQDPAVSGLRSAIANGFKGSTFRFTGQLTSHFFARVKVVVLGVLFAPDKGIPPLSRREQVALKNFVRSGGTAVIFTDNDSFEKRAPAQNASLLSPFGLRASGTLSGDQTASFVGSPNPIEAGPFGTATQLDTFDPGWFSKLGKSTALAAFAYNSEPALAYLPAQGGSGTVVLFSDASLMLDANRTADDQTAILNALSLAK